MIWRISSASHLCGRKSWDLYILSMMQVYLDPKERNTTEFKLETFSGVYKKLTGKEVVFEYPIQETVV